VQAVLALLPTPSSADNALREADAQRIARIIDTDANWDRTSGDDSQFEHQRAVAMTKAKRVLAALSQPGSSESGGEEVRNAAEAIALDQAEADKARKEMARK